MSSEQSGAGQAVVWTATSTISLGNRWDHAAARLGLNRMGHRVAPGLYALGDPSPNSLVFVTANYSLSFDALRSALAGSDGYLLVLDTQGINVWCAAGKGTFGTDELVCRVEEAGLREVVRHRRLILPQLGAPGVAAHEVKRRTGFAVEYGPVRAADLPAYVETHKATPAMRQVRFGLRDRLVLIPVEVMHTLIPMLVAAVVAYVLGGLLASAAVVGAVLAGVVLLPILLPWLPTHDFSTKGFVLGAAISLPFAAAVLLKDPQMALGLRLAGMLAYLLALPPVTAFLALNFTGSTTFTSRTGVRREIFRYIPAMAGSFGMGVLLTLALSAVRWLGVMG